MREWTLDPARLAQVTTLGRGAHASREAGLCMVEAAAWVAGEPHADHPACVSPVIAAFCRPWQDDMDDAARDRWALPLVPVIVGTATTTEDEVTRRFLCANTAVRVLAPLALRAAGRDAEADRLAALDPVVDAATARAADRAAWAARAAAAWAAAARAARAAWAAADAAADAAWPAAAPAAATAAATAVAAIGAGADPEAVHAACAELVRRMAAVGRETSAEVDRG